MTLLRILTRVFAAADRPASYGILGLAAEYSLDGGCDEHCRQPSDVYDTHRRTKVTVPETISRWLLGLLKKRKNRSLGHPLGDVGNVRTPSIARWKARGRLYIRHLNFFRYLLWLRRYERKSVEVGVFRRGWVILSTDFRGKGQRPPTSVVSENYSDCCFVWYQNIHSASFGFVTIHASDRQTDRQTELRQQYRALHYMQSHGKNEVERRRRLEKLWNNILYHILSLPRHYL